MFRGGLADHRSILSSLGSYQLCDGRVTAVTKETLSVEVTPLFAGCEPNKRQTKAIFRTTPYAAARVRFGGVPICVGFWRLVRKPTLFTTRKRHRIPFSMQEESQVPVRRLLVLLSAERGEINVTKQKRPQDTAGGLWIISGIEAVNRQIDKLPILRA